MNEIVSFLFSFSGRISRMQWWLGSIPLVGLSCASSYYWIPGILDFSSDALLPTVWADTITQLAILVPTTALTAKRLQDQNWRPWAAFALGAAFTGFAIAPHFGFLEDPDKFSTAELVFSLSTIAATLAMMIDNGFLRGTKGSNRYGPDPLATKPQKV